MLSYKVHATNDFETALEVISQMKQNLLGFDLEADTKTKQINCLILSDRVHTLVYHGPCVHINQFYIYQ